MYKIRGTEHSICCLSALLTPLNAGVTDRWTDRHNKGTLSPLVLDTLELSSRYEDEIEYSLAAC